MKLLERLMNTSSRIEKEMLLRGITEHEKKTFIYAYDPTAIYHHKFADIDVDLDRLGEPSEELFDLLDFIIEQKSSSSFVRDQIEEFADENGDLIKLIINKDLRCGVSATTFNKVSHDKIPQFKVQLAKDVELAKVSFPCTAQIKYDGVRLVLINKKGIVKFFTRNGKEVPLPELKERLESLSLIDYVLDGEIVFKAGLQEGRTTISGMINSAMHGGTIDESAIDYFIFDGMPLNMWELQKCSRTYHERLKYIKLILDALSITGSYLHEALMIMVNDLEEAENFFEGVLAMGYEGLILKHLSHHYTFKRSADWVKVKETKTTELICRLIEPGNGKYQGMVGALLCQGVVEGKEINVSVGSGLTDDGRNAPFETYLNKTIEVKYNSIIQDSKTGKWSLFLPRFVTLRNDKD